MVTLSAVADAIELAHGYTSYYSKTNETIGPDDVRNLDGPTNSRYYDVRRQWDTQIAIVLAEEEFGVCLTNHDIAHGGPWRDTVRSIRDAINAEIAAEEEFDEELAND
jgi:hypothetical protein